MRVAEVAQYNYFVGLKNVKKNNISFKSQTSPLTPEQAQEISDLRVFNHHIYEYKKGLRNLILTTEKSEHRETIENKLKKNNIPYLINDVNDKKINVFFGADACVNVVKTFDKQLNKLSPEQDFMLGIMLGYDRLKQCDRYLNIKNKKIISICK